MKGVSSGSGKMLVPVPITKWLYVFFSVLMSALSLLSKEQGITVIAVCVAFDVFLNWDCIWKVIAPRNNHNITAERKTNISALGSQQTNNQSTVASLGNGRHINNVRTEAAGSHANGKSSKPLPAKGRGKLSNSCTGSEFQNMAQRIGRRTLQTVT